MNVQTLPEGVTRNAEYGYPECVVDGTTVAAYIAGDGYLAMSVTGQPPCDNDAEPTEVAFLLTPADLDRITAMFSAVLRDGYDNPFLGEHLTVTATDPIRRCAYCEDIGTAESPVDAALADGSPAHSDCAQDEAEDQAEGGE